MENITIIDRILLRDVCCLNGIQKELVTQWETISYRSSLSESHKINLDKY